MTEINPQIPLSGDYTLAMKAQQPDIAGGMQRGMQMTQEYGAASNAADDFNDKQVTKSYLESGGHFDTPDGISKAVTDLQGKISPKSYEKLIGMRDNSKNMALELQQKYAEAGATKIQQGIAQHEYLLRGLAGPLEAYKVAKEAGGSQAAVEDFNKAKSQIINDMTQQKNGDGSPMWDPAVVNRIQQMTPEQLAASYETSTFHIEQMKKALEISLKKSEIDKNQAMAKSYGEKGLGNQLALIDEQERSGQITPEEAAAARAKLTSTGGGRAGAAGVQPFDKLTPEAQHAIDASVENLLINHKQPPAYGTANYSQVMARLGEFAAKAGMTTDELLIASADTKARVHALQGFESRVANMSRAENVLGNELGNLEQNMAAVDLSKYPAASHAQLAVARQMGDPNVTKMDQSAEAVFNEFESIMTGNPGALNVADVQKAHDSYYKVQTPQQLKAWIDNAHNMIERAHQANEKTREQLLNGIHKSLGHGAKTQPSLPTPAGGAGQQPAQVSNEAQLQAIRESIPYLQDDLQKAQASGDAAAVQAAQRSLQDAQSRLQSGGAFTPAAQRPQPAQPARPSVKPVARTAPETLQKPGQPLQVGGQPDLVKAFKEGRIKLNGDFVYNGKVYTLTKDPSQ